MKNAWVRSFYKLSLSAAIFFLLSTGFTASTSGQEASQSITVGNARITGVPEDWTHHHVVFSDPGTEADALKNGTYSEWRAIVNDPRYILQQLKRRLPAQGPAADDIARIEEEARARDAARIDEIAAAEATLPDWRRIRGKLQETPKIKQDWSMVLGPSATAGAGNYPAKFSFVATATPNCGNAATPDFVVYNTSVAGSSSQASIVAYDNLYSSCPATIQAIPSVYWAFNTSGTVNTSVVLSLTGSQVLFVQTPASGSAQLVLLKWAATPTGRTVTGSVPSGSKTLTVSGGLTSMDVGAVLSFTGMGLPAGDTIATVTNGTTGTLTAAATATITNQTLTISADAGGPAAPSSVTPSNYSACAAPCMTTLTFGGSGTRADTVSSPFYDYAHDTLYVGDASGGLHKFTPVLNGTPTEVGTPWATLGSTAVTSPAYDPTSGLVFAGDASGILYSVSSSATVVKSFQMAVSPGIVDGPIVDPSAEQVYVFVASDINGSNSSSPCDPGSGEACNGVFQLPAKFTATTALSESVMGIGLTAHPVYDGTFDNIYYTSASSTSPSGDLYVCGYAGGSTEPKLSLVKITANAFTGSGSQTIPNGNSVDATNIDNPMTSGASGCSPVTEVLNGSTDYIFLGVTNDGNLTASGANKCSGSGVPCVYSFNVTTALTGTTAPLDGLTATGGSSGIIIDNTSSTTGASNIYYSTLTSGACTTSGGSGGCAVQVAQSGL
jgi:hypothetical protein